MDFMLAFWCSLAICRPSIIRFLKIIIHIAITSRIIDNKLDKMEGRAHRFATRLTSVPSRCWKMAPHHNKLFCTILTKIYCPAMFSSARMSAPIKTLCNQITASWSSTIEWKNVIYLRNGQNKPSARRDRGLSGLCAEKEKRGGKTNDFSVVR